MNIEHRQVEANAIALHVAEAGTGPAVLFVHGFPDTWRGWRRQMEAVVVAGYRAISLDMRGYGESSKPEEARAYTVFQCVGDLVGILDALGVEQAVLVGHDFGAAISWSAAMMRPDRFRAVFCLSVPPLPLARPSMIEQMQAAGEDDFYMFSQMRPEADREWADASVTIPGMYYWMSGIAPVDQRWEPLDPAKALNRPSPVGLPGFVDPDDAAAAIAEFERYGFHGPLNCYRAMQPYFEEAGAFVGATVQPPSFFAFGAEDGMVRLREMPEEALRTMAIDLRGYLKLDGVGHWPQLEASDRVSTALLSFLSEVA